MLINCILKYVKTEKSYIILLLFIFYQINADLVSINVKKNLTDPKSLNGS